MRTPAGSVFAFLAEHRGELFPAEMFADMYPSANGRPSMPPQILAAAITLQALHGLSDFETVQELRCDLRWKPACGLGLNDMAFDPSLLACFRRRLARSARPNRVLDAMREVVKATGVLKGKHRRALDSTVLDDTATTQDTVTQIIAAVRAVLAGDHVHVDAGGQGHDSSFEAWSPPPRPGPKSWLRMRGGGDV
jgi:transposase